MNTNLKKQLLLGSAIVAVGAFASGASFATELQFDSNDDNLNYEAVESSDTAFNATIGDDGLSHDLRVMDNAIIKIDANSKTIGDGDATLPAIVAGAEGKTLTLENEANDGGDFTLTIDGDISVTDTLGGTTYNALNITLLGNANGNTADDLIVDFNGANNNLGTGTLLINAEVNDALDEVKALISGNLTAQTISLDDEGANGSAYVTFDGTTQAINANIIGADNDEGIVTVASGTTTLTGNIGGTAADGDDEVDNVVVASGATLITNGNIFTANGIDIGGAAAGTLRLTGTGVTVAGAIDSGTNADLGVVDVEGSATFTGAIGGNEELDQILVGTGATATFGAAVDIAGAGATSALTLEAADATAVVGTGATDNPAFNGNILGNGILVLNQDTGGTTGQAVTGNVGANTAGNRLARVEVRSDAGGADAHTLTGNLYATTLQFGTAGTTTANTADGTLTLDGNDATIDVANVTTLVNGEGNITVDANGGTETTVTIGSIGASGMALGDIKFDATNEVIDAVITGDVYATAISLDDNADADQATITFKGTSAQSINSTIDAFAGAAGDGDIVVGASGTNSNVTFNGKLGNAVALENFTIVSGSTATIKGTTNDFDENLTVDGTLVLAQNVAMEVADVAAGSAAGTLTFTIGTDVNGNDSASTLTLSGADVDFNDNFQAADQVLNLAEGTGVITNDQNFKILVGNADADNLTNGTAVNDEFALFDFALYRGDAAGITGGVNTEVYARASLVDASTVTATANNANAATAILATTATQRGADDTPFARVYDSVSRAGTANIDERVEAIQSTVDGGNVIGSLNSIGQTVSANDARLSSLRDGSAVTGMTAGNVTQGLSAWAQAFGLTGEQDERDGIDGYDVDTLGFALGLDTQTLAEDWVFGLGFSYADSDVDSNNANRTETEIDSYQFTLYGNYDLDDATYVAGQVGYVWGDNEATRFNVGGVNGVNANADFDSDTLFASLEAGRSYAAGNGTTITPKALVNYVHYDAEDYTETGAGGASLRVDNDALNIFEIGVGADLSWNHQQADGSYLQPKLDLGVRYDVIGDEVESTNTLTGNGATFKTEGFDPAQVTFNVGAGLTYFSTMNWDFSAQYDFEYKEDYDAHAGTLRASYKF